MALQFAHERLSLCLVEFKEPETAADNVFCRCGTFLFRAAADEGIKLFGGCAAAQDAADDFIGKLRLPASS
jgi:hypothetical protein